MESNSTKVKIKSVGGFLPSKILTNKDMEKLTETTDEWILQRTGITKRYICETTTSDMAFEAVKNCLNTVSFLKADGIFVDESVLAEKLFDTNNHANLSYKTNTANNKILNVVPAKYTECKNIDCLIVATTTPDLTFPSTACITQAKLKQIGINIGFAFDVQAVCAGFVYALGIANSFIKSGFCSSVLVVGADKLSSILNWQDRTTCVLFGDGAGCVLLEKNQTNSSSDILHQSLYSDGSLSDILKTSSGTSTDEKSGYIIMEGKEVFKHAVTKMSDCISSIIQKSGFNKDEIDFVIAHQANERILDGVAKKLEMTKTNFIKTVDIHANTSSASIPLALNECLNKGIIQRGNKIIFEALGGGLTWGGALCIW